MRHVLMAGLLGLGLVAIAGEAIEVPALRVPGGSATLRVSETLLSALGMIKTDADAVHKEIERLNGEREALRKAVRSAKAELLGAQEKLDKALEALTKQEEELDAFIVKRLPEDRKADYAVRKQLQPAIDWLRLKDDQVSQLLAKQRAQADEQAKARTECEEKLKALQALGTPQSQEEHKAYAAARKAYTEAIKRHAAATQAWLANIESVLTDEQKSVWQTRFRRAASPIDLGAPAPAPKE